MIIIILFIILILFIISLIIKKFYTFSTKQYVSLSLLTANEMYEFKKYIENNVEWQKAEHVSLGISGFRNSDHYWEGIRYIHNKTNIPCNFNDTFLSIQGYYVYEKIKVDNYDKTFNMSINKDSIKYIKIYILNNNDNINPINILNQIKQFNKMQNPICSMRYYTKTYLQEFENKKFLMFSTVAFNQKLLKSDQMSSFFHKEKSEIMRLMKNISLPKCDKLYQRKKLCILLHGPPGSGKTTLICKLALQFYMKIVEFSFRKTSKKRDLNEIIIRLSEKSIILIENLDEDIDVINNLNPQEKKQVTLSDISNFIKGDHIYAPSRLIIFATANNYNKVRETFPDLISGRHMIPIHINYITSENLQEISEFYFKQRLTSIPDKIDIPTCLITHYAVLYSGTENGFLLFQSEISKLINKEILPVTY